MFVEVQRLFEVTQGTLVRQATVSAGSAKPKRATTRRLGKMAQVKAKITLPIWLEPILGYSKGKFWTKFVETSGSDWKFSFRLRADGG